MSVISVVQEACLSVGVEPPAIVIGSTDRTIIEMRAWLQATAEQIAAAYDWRRLALAHTITGDGTTEAFSFPADFARMQGKASLWSSRLDTAMTPISDPDRWLELEVRDFDHVVNSWIIYGGQLHIRPAPVVGETVRFFYQSRNLWSGAKAAFTTDADTFLLDERLLTYGLIARSRMEKGVPFQDDLTAFEEHKERLIVADRGPRAIAIGPSRITGDARIAYPRAVVP